MTNFITIKLFTYTIRNVSTHTASPSVITIIKLQKTNKLKTIAVN